MSLTERGACHDLEPFFCNLNTNLEHFQTSNLPDRPPFAVEYF
jgi:hypothetical protein